MHGIALPKTRKSNNKEMENPYFYVHYHKIIVMIDDIFGCDTCLVLYQHVNLKGLKLNGFSIANVFENFKASYFFHSGSDRSAFVLLCVVFLGLHGSINFFLLWCSKQKLTISFPKSQWTYYRLLVNFGISSFYILHITFQFNHCDNISYKVMIK